MAIKKRRKNILIYNDKIMIISIGIGTQGALPGSALYAGATCEGIGRFIFNGFNGVDSSENITKKADLWQTICVTRTCVKIHKWTLSVRKIDFSFSTGFLFPKKKKCKKQKKGIKKNTPTNCISFLVRLGFLCSLEYEVSNC